MIPSDLVDFVHGPVVMFLGTRSAELKPSFSWVFGAIARGEEGTMTLLVPDIEGEQSFRNIEDNGRVALTVAEAISHTAYQFKGHSIETRPTTAEESAVQEIHKQKLGAHLVQVGYENDLLDRFVTTPSTAVTFTARRRR